ncbi:MAG: formylglycine-generating enzyme family protein [Gammaproteobacteria bacterium]|nr:formylglycine-generating enzyme family protein [Gammaproteobacteria bacterium]
MSKPQSETELPQAPGRVVGLTIMCVVIICVAVWMSIQSQQQMNPEITELSSPAQATMSGFLDEAWFLPDEPLLGFVRIPSGSFTMGSNPALDRLAYENERWSSSRRQGTVEIDDFYIGMFEVTAAQFRAFTAEYPDLASGVAVDVKGDMPVTGMTWPEALAYARWLQQKLENSADTPLELRNYLAAGGQVSIPSEAEWEKAARGGDGRIFPWGNTPSTELANYGSSTVLAVGSRPCTECAFGLQDMSGNVWELTRSPLQDYPYNPNDDAENLSEDALWVMRGGSFSDGVGNVRAAVRGGVDPSVRNNTIGFRVVISKP